MLSSVLPKRKFPKLILVTLTAFFAAFVSAPETPAKIIVQNSGNIGVIKGIVRDEAGTAIADAYISIFRVGTSKLLKQVRSAADGSFLAKIIPGTYSVLAVAQGFNAVTLAEVEVNRSTELNYGFKLERVGNGKTLPELRSDRNSSKKLLRAAQMERSIYQANEGDAPIVADSVAQTAADEENSVADDTDDKNSRSNQTIVETYFANADEENYTGLNFAHVQSLSENAQIIFVGQTGSSKSAPKRFQTNFNFRPTENHQIRLSGAIANLGRVKLENQEQTLGQLSLQATDEWKVKAGIILVFGLDYSKFTGAGKDFSISPRIGFQYDVNSKTRFRTAYTAPADERSWQNAIEFEGTEVLFREPAAAQDVVLKKDKPQINKNRRLEFGVERVLDNKSNVEASAFFDTVNNRGINATGSSAGLDGTEDIFDFVANQQGAAQGARIVYTRRLNGVFSTSGGYAFGNSQKLSKQAISNPANVFENAFAQTIFGQFDADLKTGTQIKTVFRLSPQATIFAIDPFQGRLAIYDPGLSVKMTQTLPNMGLPIHAEAILDGRNLFDFQPGLEGDEGSLKLNLQRRNLRGGILVRF